MTEMTYTAIGVSCGRCEQAVSSKLEKLASVDCVEIDLDTKRLFVRGENPDDVLRATIEEAGYEAA
jgi:copper chaperone CopZ